MTNKDSQNICWPKKKKKKKIYKKLKKKIIHIKYT